MGLTQAPVTERTIHDAERDHRAAVLRAKGWTYKAIAFELGLSSKSAAYYAVQRALRDAVQESATELRTLEGERLDLLWEPAYQLTKHHDPMVALHAVDRCLRVLERRSKLFGLDAPVKVEAKIVGAVEAEIETLAAELAAYQADVVDGEVVEGSEEEWAGA